MISYYLKCAWNIVYSYFTWTTKIAPVENEPAFKLNENLYLVKLHGTYKEMGVQYGQVLRDVLQRDVYLSLDFFKRNATFYLKGRAKTGDIFAALDEVYEKNKANYNSDVMDYLQGMAEGAVIPFDHIRRLNTVTELTDNHCLLLSKVINGKRLNLRTLDFGSPHISQVLTVFNPVGRTPYAALQGSFVGGVFTGISKTNVFFGESYYDFKLDEGGTNLEGMPFHHISHRILADARTIDDAENILNECNRQSNLELLVATESAGKIFLSSKFTFRIAYPGESDVYSVTPNEMKRFTQNQIYLDSLEHVIKEFIPRTKSGEFHIMMAYDNKVYVSVTTNVLQAYNNTFYEFRMDQLFGDGKL
jgi:hypothetical protein